MSFGRDALNTVLIDEKDDGFYYRIRFRGEMSEEAGPFPTRDEAANSGNRELAKLEAEQTSR